MIKDCLKLLKANRAKLTVQQFRTFKGQIISGDYDGFKKGLNKVLKR